MAAVLPLKISTNSIKQFISGDFLAVANGGTAKTSIAANKFPFATSSNTYTEGTARQGAEQTYTITGSIIWTATTAPSGALTATYRWTQILNMVTVRFVFFYATQGSSVTGLTFDLPADLPAPEKPSGITGDGNFIASGYGGSLATVNADESANGRIALHSLAASSTGYEMSMTVAAANTKVFVCTITYFTASGF